MSINLGYMVPWTSCLGVTVPRIYPDGCRRRRPLGGDAGSESPAAQPSLRELNAWDVRSCFRFGPGLLDGELGATLDVQKRGFPGRLAWYITLGE